jgi:translation initiation factor 2 subunit 1
MYKKSGIPEVNDLIICTIEKLTSHEVYVMLDEYDNVAGMIHTSEMDRRTVRNMKVMLKPGRQLVCKVMDIDKHRNMMNLSLRRVGEGQRRSKIQTWKNEKKADDLLQFFAKKHKIEVSTLYTKFNDNIVDNYGGMYPFLIEVARLGEETLKELNIQSKLAQELFELIKQRIKIPKAIIFGELRMHSNKGMGLNAIKQAAEELTKLGEKNDYETTLVYMGAPKYQLKISADNKKKADQALEEIVSRLQSLLGGKTNVEFVRSKN